MNLKPLGDRLVVKRDEAEQTTASGLIIASSSKEKPTFGKVLAVGEGRLSANGTLVPMPVKAGDRILFGKYAGTEMTVDGEEVLIMNLNEVFAIVE